MMRAIKDNKVYTVTDEREMEFYRLKGFDIVDDDGNIKKHGAGKTVPYEKYEELHEKYEELLAEMAALKEKKAK